jgi:hypothetical protein
MPRRHPAEMGLPPLPAREKREVQVKIRLTPSEAEALAALRPDLSVSGIVAQLVDDVLTGRHRPAWVAPADQGRSN